MSLGRRVGGVFSVLSVALAACSSGSDAAGENAAGIAQLAVNNAPGDVGCLQTMVTGSRTVQQQFPLMPGESAVFTLQGLPVGSVVFTQQAFASDCASVTASSLPTWLSDPVSATLTAGVPAQITIVLRRNGQATVTSDFNDDGMSPPDAGAGGGGNMCQYFFDDSTLPLGPGGTRPPLP